VATLAVYWQVVDYGFVNYDNNVYVTENPSVRRGFSWENVFWAFTEFHAGNWHPLTWLSHMLDCQLFGLKAGMHHLTNLFFHIANSILLFFVFRRMTGALWQSAFVAGLFALHPLHVESVAWVAERKDVLSTFFWMLTMWAYVRYTEQPGVNRYLLVVLLFVSGLMAKPMVVTLPFVLLLMDFWPLGRLKLFSPDKGDGTRLRKSFDFSVIWEKIPLFVLSLFSCVMTFLSERGEISIGSVDGPATSSRIGNALVSYMSYIKKMTWPNDLAVFYPHPETVPMWKALGAGCLLLFISITVLRYARSRPYLAAGWLWYLGTLIPVIGIVQVGLQAMADRYSYIPLVGLFILISWGGAELMEGWRHRKITMGVTISLALLMCMILTWTQVRNWRNSTTLFRRAIEVTSKNYLAHNNLGLSLMGQGKAKEAMKHYSEAIRINPSYAGAYYNLGVAKVKQGRLQEAVRHYSEAVRIEPKNVEAHNNLGDVMARLGHTELAKKHYVEALRINPAYAKAHVNLGNLLTYQGNMEAAIQQYEKALKINLKLAEAHANLAIVLASQGQLDDAIGHFEAALRIKPDFAVARKNLERTLKKRVRLGRAAE